MLSTVMPIVIMLTVMAPLKVVLIASNKVWHKKFLKSLAANVDCCLFKGQFALAISSCVFAIQPSIGNDT
jgi:hypothetical protein